MKCFKLKLNSGFTLVEMMVVMTLVTILATVIIFNHQKFNDNLELTNLSYEVALSLRQAQVYGVSVKEFKEGTTEEQRFGTPYGVHFNSRTSVLQKQFIFFADRNKDGRYTGDLVNCANSATGSGDVCLQKTTIGRGNYIKDLCEAVNNKWQCNGNSRDSATATFMRPDPDAHLRMAAGGQELTALKICLSSPLGKIKEIIVYPTGQISVYNGACVNGEDVVQAGQAEI